MGRIPDRELSARDENRACKCTNTFVFVQGMIVSQANTPDPFQRDPKKRTDIATLRTALSRENSRSIASRDQAQSYEQLCSFIRNYNWYYRRPSIRHYNLACSLQVATVGSSPPSRGTYFSSKANARNVAAGRGELNSVYNKRSIGWISIKKNRGPRGHLQLASFFARCCKCFPTSQFHIPNRWFQLDPASTIERQSISRFRSIDF